MPSKALTPREQAFIVQYLIDKNGAAAAIRSGYSERGAKQTAHNILKRPAVKAAVAKELKAQLARLKLSADDVLLDLKRYGDKAEKKGDLATATTTRVWLGKNH